MRVQAEFFEPFWDSGEERVGELGARGWKAWMLQQERGGWLQPSAGETHTVDYSWNNFYINLRAGMVKIYNKPKRVCLLFSAEEEEEEEEDEEEVKDRSQPRWTVWLEVEPSREAAHWLPWRPDKAKGQSEVDCEDPDRQVLVSCMAETTECYWRDRFA